MNKHEIYGGGIFGMLKNNSKGTKNCKGIIKIKTKLRAKDIFT